MINYPVTMLEHVSNDICCNCLLLHFQYSLGLTLLIQIGAFVKIENL